MTKRSWKSTRILWYEESLLSNQTQDGVQRQIVASQLLLAVALRARSCAAGDQGATRISVTTVKRNGTRIKRAMLPELGVPSTTNVALPLVLVKATRSIVRIPYSHSEVLIIRWDVGYIDCFCRR